MSIGQFAFLQSLRFSILGLNFGILGVSVEIWVFLGVLVSYKMKRGTKIEHNFWIYYETIQFIEKEDQRSPGRSKDF